MPEDAWTYVWLAAAAFAAGIVNSIAGGGTLLTFPSLLAVVPPVVANGTSTVALVPGSLSAVWGFRRDIATIRRWVPLLVPPSIVGGLLGSFLVTRLPERYFDAMVPWLILTAALLFLFQPLLARHAGASEKAAPGAGKVAAVVVLQFFVAVYGGYFGAGIGILMLSALGLMGLSDIHAMNCLKNLLAACINGVSVLVFAGEGVVRWELAAIMAPTAIAGAYAGSRLAQRIDQRIVRGLVVAIGLGLALYYFYQRWNS
jgi:uncharacterized membrane protein YfcA